MIDMAVFSDEQISHSSVRPLVALAHGLVQLSGGTATTSTATVILVTGSTL